MLPPLQNCDTVAEGLNFGHIMAGQDHGFPLRLQPPDLFVEGNPAFHIEPGRRLIEKNNVRVAVNTSASAKCSRRFWPVESPMYCFSGQFVDSKAFEH